jgi:hypothetical protein
MPDSTPKAEPTVALLLGADQWSFVIADIGAAFYGETPPYQSLMDCSSARLFAIDADPRHTERLRAQWGGAAEVVVCAIGDGQHTPHLWRGFWHDLAAGAGPRHPCLLQRVSDIRRGGAHRADRNAPAR